MSRSRLARILILPLLLGCLLAVSGPAQAAPDVRVGFGGWGKIDFGIKLQRAARILDRKVYDGCGGKPAVYPSPRGLSISHPFARYGYSIKKMRVTYMGGYGSNIHGPHGIHPGMRLGRALNLMGTDRHKLVGEYVTGWYEMGPRGKHALVIQGYEGKVSQVAVVKSRKIAKRVATNPGC